MKVPDRETGAQIIWLTDGLLSNGGHALPTGLMAALREYKTALLAASANERWARPGCGSLANVCHRVVTSLKPTARRTILRPVHCTCSQFGGSWHWNTARTTCCHVTWRIVRIQPVTPAPGPWNDRSNPCC